MSMLERWMLWMQGVMYRLKKKTDDPECIRLSEKAGEIILHSEKALSNQELQNFIGEHFTANEIREMAGLEKIQERALGRRSKYTIPRASEAMVDTYGAECPHCGAPDEGTGGCSYCKCPLPVRYEPNVSTVKLYTDGKVVEEINRVEMQTRYAKLPEFDKKMAQEYIKNLEHRGCGYEG